MEQIGRTFVLFGAIILVFGVILMFAGKIPGIGRLPGDILIRRGNFTFYFPLATSILVSLILTLLFSIFARR
ncbi:MAG: DUF2905 domain-containing protein [Bacillota bacterium]